MKELKQVMGVLLVYNIDTELSNLMDVIVLMQHIF